MDVQAYLTRIGIAAVPEASVSALRALVRAHLETVPFENLDICEGGGVLPLTEDALFDKVVRRRRGGYCFELNRLFYLLLRELGYDCYPAAARVLYRFRELRPLSHRVTVVCLDNQKWLCDVGYGGPGPKGLLSLGTSVTQSVAGEEFSVCGEGGELTIFRHDPDGRQPLLRFADKPWPEVDFETLNGYFSLHPASVFTQKPVVYLCIPDGQMSLVGDKFTVRRQGLPDEERTVPDSAGKKQLIKEKFGIEQ